MRCPSCGHDNPGGSQFCESCGARLAPVCPACRVEVSLGARFCSACGHELDEPAPAARTPTPAPAFALPASLAAGRYQVQRFIGEGGKKRVYLARDARLDSDVAIALVKTEGLDADGLTRIRREAQAMGRLRDHPHIVTVLDIGDEDGQPYIVQEYMEGGSVENLLAEAEGHRLALDQALRIAGEVCLALDHAHSRSIIHRDLKPGNIWLAENGTAKLGDFGLAMAVDRTRLTQAGMMVGTATYMPPEQALGGEVTSRSDVYALGCVLYEMVAGRPPFLGDDSIAVISQHVNTSPVALTWHNPEAPQALETLVMRLLAKAPEERPESAGSVARELQRIAEVTTEERAVPAPDGPGAELRGVDWGRFIGRHEEMDQLKGALENALSGRGSLVMLVGEPGIGKTRLAEEFGVYASLRGAQVLTGRCYEGEIALPYRPFAEAFRQYMRARPDPELRQELGEGAPEVAKLVSEVRQRFPDIPEAAPLEADAERLRLFESVSAFVGNAAAATPLVLVLDDIHWADKPSLLMLRYLARATAGQRVLLIGVYRDVELDRAHPLADVIATLRHEQPYQRILLRGLSEEDVLSFFSAIEPSEERAPQRQALALALYRETEGNPFFMREVVSHLVEEGKIYREGGRWTSSVNSPSELGIPEGVREVVGRRLTKLSDGCNRMLTVASTMTGGFSWDELKAISGESEPVLLDLLDEAVAAQLIEERSGDSAGKYDFTHAIIRQTLYGELSTPRRVLLHRQIGQALEGLHAGNLEPHLAELAHHFYQAAPGGDVDKAIDYARRAGDRAVEMLAYEEAAEQYEIALQALELRDEQDDRQRFELLFALGEAYGRADLPEKSLATLEQAVALAERLAEPELQATAACSYAFETFRGPFQGSQVDVPALERALAEEQPPALRARLLGHLSIALAEPGGAGPLEHRRQIAREARDLAAEAGDARALSQALRALLGATQGPEHIEQHLETADELLAVAEQAHDRDGVIFARIHRIVDLAQLGEMEEVEREIATTTELADQMREPIYSGMRPMWASMVAATRGRYEEAERFTFQVAPIAQRTQHVNYTNSLSAQIADIRWAQGRMMELEPTILQRMEIAGSQRAWEAVLAVAHLDAGDSAKAREWFDRVARNGFADAARDMNWIITMCLATVVASRLRDRPRAALLYDALSPYAGRQIVVGMAITCDGSMCRPLGMLAATLGNWDTAGDHFERALVFDERIGAWPWLARTRYEYAGMLHERGRPEDREKALALVNQALATFEELGMPKDVERALALKLELQGVSSIDSGTSIDAVAAAVRSDQPDLPPKAVAPDGTVTILFTDIKDSTATAEMLGDERWLTIIRAHNAIVREQVTAHGGVEVSNRGDGFMLAFPSPSAGILCAIAMQAAFTAYNREHSDEPIGVRIGLHTGAPARDEDTFYGTDVNVAARIADDVAQGGEIVVSSRLRGLLEDDHDIRFDAGREVELKGLSGTQRVYVVAWEQGR